jgi:hypothetical protein
MSNRFLFLNCSPVCSSAQVADVSSSEKSIIALDIQTKLQFRTEDGTLYHEYAYPSDHHIQNCGGYIDKLVKYRSKSVRDAVNKLFSPDSQPPDNPIVKGRSILVDILLTKMIARFILDEVGVKPKLFDHGCTVAEHFDMINHMLGIYCSKPTQARLSYYGLDISPLALSAAHIMNAAGLAEDFHLVLAEGSDFDLPGDSMDFSLSVGVVNHVQNPLRALSRLFEVTRYGVVTVLWITGEPEGFWAVNHSGIPNYFFSVRDLHQLSLKHSTKGSFYFADFTPEKSSTQPNSYYGISDDRMKRLGSYTLVFCNPDFVTEELKPIDFGDM